MTDKKPFSQTYEGETAFKSKHTNRKWVLVKNNPDPRKREWALYSNGKVIRTKKGAITLGGNIGTTIQRAFSKTDYQNKPKLKVGDRKQYQDLQKAKKDLFGKTDNKSKEVSSDNNKYKKVSLNKNNKGALHNENKERKNTLNLYGTDPKTKKKFLSNVHTKHYKTGERLGVLTRNQRRKYDAEAMGDDGKIRTFEGEVAKFEKETKHGKPHKRKTLYRSHVRSGGKFTKKDSRR